ncbi:hypothetical protein HK096_004534 [Nowakowskiella sp. JEL0078]|nr:hypothetical protein HK096_004534 [Nowakowskiella sp. JEL0078]
MQNWDHLLNVMDHINRIPKEPHGCDFSRVKNWYLDGQAKYFRQTLLFSSLLTPEINSLFLGGNSKMLDQSENEADWSSVTKLWCSNFEGKFKIRRDITSGSIAKILIQVPQVLPGFLNDSKVQKRTVLVVPSYFDFVRLRNAFDERDCNFEYTPTNEIPRARSHLYSGTADFLVITERFHFFRRYRIRGIHHIMFYAPPTIPELYPDLINMIETISTVSDSKKNKNMKIPLGTLSPTVLVLFNKFDKLAIERIVGTRRSARLCDGEKDIYLFA